MLRKKNDTGATLVEDARTVSPAADLEIDVSLIEHALGFSYEERLEAHESARQLMQDLKEAGRQYYARQSKSTT
jgi:hypothetical protein